VDRQPGHALVDSRHDQHRPALDRQSPEGRPQLSLLRRKHGGTARFLPRLNSERGQGARGADLSFGHPAGIGQCGRLPVLVLQRTVGPHAERHRGRPAGLRCPGCGRRQVPAEGQGPPRRDRLRFGGENHRAGNRPSVTA